VFGDYCLRTFGLDPAAHHVEARALAAAAIAFAAIVNIVGVNLGAFIVGLSTIVKFSALGILVGAVAFLGSGHGGSMTNLTTATGATLGAGSLGLALVSVLWAYDGFGDLSFVSGEIRDPQRNLPRAIIFGTIAIIVIYVSANVAYLYMSPIDEVARSPLVAADTMMALFGPVGAILVSSFVMISTFSSLNGIMLASPRIFFAMAADRLFFQAMSKVHPRYKTPYVAILLAAVLGMGLVLSQSFERLTNTFVLAVWPFYAVSIAAIYRLRRLRPDLPRPYRVVGYPIVPAIFIASVCWFVINALVNEPRPTLITFALILAGVPVYFVGFSSRRRIG
jgi:amino acid transporter